MSVKVKICGLTTPEAVQAACEGGAAYLGFVFYPPSRRAITPECARDLVRNAPQGPQKVGLFVDPSDNDLRATLAEVPLDLIQLHGNETPTRVASVRALTHCPVIKAIPLATPKDLASVAAYEKAADYLLFDTKLGPVPSGGSGQSFDWALLSGKTFAKPWMLAGGLNRGNLAKAVAITGATIVDLSSGVEDRTGHKDPEAIKALLALAASLNPSESA